jgi:hypothetical protein
MEFVLEGYHVKSEPKFYGKNYGWAYRYRKSGKALISVYPAQDGFTAQVILTKDQVKKVAGIKVGKKVRKTIDDAHMYPEGKLLFIKVNSPKDAADIKKLLLAQAKPAR